MTLGSTATDAAGTVSFAVIGALFCAGVLSFGVAAAQSSPDANGVTIRGAGLDRFDVALDTREALTEGQALSRLWQAFGTRCGNRTARLESYTFNGTEKLSGGSTDDAFALQGVVRCTETPSPRADGERARSTESEPEITARIDRLSRVYLRDLTERGPDAVAERRSDELRAMAARVQRRAAEHRVETGAIRSLTITGVTVYDNPPGSPRPGLFVAADYTARFDKVPIQCGYLVWQRDDTAVHVGSEDGRWRVIREEMGRLDATQTRGLTPQAQAELERAIGCRGG